MIINYVSWIIFAFAKLQNSEVLGLYDCGVFGLGCSWTFLAESPINFKFFEIK
jgi:hypothetical protein